jgi:hypothetical protein
MTERSLKDLQTNPDYLQTPIGMSDRGLTLKDAITEVMLPILAQDIPRCAAAATWQKIATAQEPVFKDSGATSTASARPPARKNRIV